MTDKSNFQEYHSNADILHEIPNESSNTILNTNTDMKTDQPMKANINNQQNDDEDEVVMEYEVYLSHGLGKSLYMIQYPLKPKDRPFDFKALKDITIKPNHGIISMDFHLNQHASDFDSDSEFKKKTKLTWKSKRVPLKSNYCIGVMRGNSLFFTPLNNVVKMLPDTQYLNEHFENEIRMIDDDNSDNELEDDKKEKKSKKSTTDTQVYQQFQTKREMRELEKSYHYIQEQEEKEKAIPLRYYDKETFNSGAIFEKLLTAPFQEIRFDMERDQYIDALVPYKEDPLTKFNKKVISLDIIKKESRIKMQIPLILQAAKILPFKRIRELATAATTDLQILNVLTSVAYFIRGRWIGNAAIASEPGMYERWNYMLVRFWRDGYIDRGEFSRVTNLAADKSLELLNLIAELDVSGRLWRLKGEEDTNFDQYTEILEAQEKQLQIVEGELRHHIENGFTKLIGHSKDKIPSVLTEDEIKKVTVYFLTQLGKIYGVVSPKLIRAKLPEYQAKKDYFKKITVEHIKKMLYICYRQFNGCYVLKRCPLGDESAPFRDALIEALNKKKELTREEILNVVESTVGRPMATNLFYKFTQELCRTPPVGSNVYVAKDGTEAL